MCGAYYLHIFPSAWLCLLKAKCCKKSALRIDYFPVCNVQAKDKGYASLTLLLSVKGIYQKFKEKETWGKVLKWDSHQSNYQRNHIQNLLTSQHKKKCAE